MSGKSLGLVLLTIFLVLIGLVFVALPTTSAWFFDSSEKRELYVQIEALGQENRRLHDEAARSNKENAILRQYIDLFLANQPASAPAAAYPASPTATVPDVPSGVLPSEPGATAPDDAAATLPDPPGSVLPDVPSAVLPGIPSPEAEATPNPIDIRVLVPTLPPISPTFVTPTATPFQG